MGMFICCLCDSPGNSDDGCEELNGEYVHPECLEQYEWESNIDDGSDAEL